MDFPDVVAGKDKGYGFQRFFCNPKSQYKSIPPSAHGYTTALAQKRAGRVSHKNTYEGRSTKPNSMVLQFNTDPKAIEHGGWGANLNTCERAYLQVCLTTVACMSRSDMHDQASQHTLTQW